MARFYQRSCVAPYPIPTTGSGAVFYGYRGPNYIVNGQFYSSSNNTQTFLNFQTTAANAECTTQLGILQVDSMFEPGLLANSFDLLGSRFTGEYNQGIFESYGTICDSRCAWTFKNHTPAPSQLTSICTNVAACSIRSGCTVSTSSTGCVCCFSQSTVAYYPCARSLNVESPSNCFRPFVPFSHGLFSVNACHCCSSCCVFCITPCTSALAEPTFGNTTTNYCLSMYSNCCSSPVCTAQTLNAVYIGSQCIPFPTYNCVQLADQFYFGTCCLWVSVTSSGNPGGCCRGNGINGAYPFSDAAQGTAEQGARVFLARSGSYNFYLFFDALRGGIQGTDVSTETSSRATIRVLNTSLNTTTVLSTWKKPSGLVIPSQPDLDDGSTYRFYMINFVGADTAAQTIQIYRPSLNLVNGTTATGSAYTLTMTAGEQQTLYADLGHNNTANSQYNHSNFRRQTVNRIWYSTDGNGTKRLHLGIYNTNGTGFVTVGNGFQNNAAQGRMWKIYSWSLDDATTSATYLGSSDLSAYAPRYFLPLNATWTTMYIGATFTNDVIFTLNQTTGLYTYQSTLPWIAPRLFKDKDGRWATQIVDYSNTTGGVNINYLDIMTAEVGQTLAITANSTSFTYTGTNINTNVSVNVYNYLGERVAKTVALSIVGATSTPGVVFSDGTYSTTVNTSNSADTVVQVRVISSTSAKIVGTVTESL